MITILMAMILKNAPLGVRLLFCLASVAADVFAISWLKKAYLKKKDNAPVLGKYDPKTGAVIQAEADGTDYYSLLTPTLQDKRDFLEAHINDLEKKVDGAEEQATEVAEYTLHKLVYDLPNLHKLINDNIKIGAAEIALFISFDVDTIISNLPQSGNSIERLQGAGRNVIYFLNHLNHSFYGKPVIPVLTYISRGVVSETAQWLYDEALFEANPDTDPEGEQIYARIRPYLDEAEAKQVNQ